MSSSPTVIITGASYGIGHALALLMAEKGYDLGLLARKEDLLEKLKQEIQKNYPDRKVFYRQCDVRDEEACHQAIIELSKELGHLDVFVANAGIGAATPAWENSWKTVSKILNTNIVGAIGSIEAAKSVMLSQKNGGHLVGISSVAAFRGLPTSSAYCTSKAALTTYLESIRLDLNPYSIKVTSVHPGYIDTPMTKNNKYMPLLISADKAARIILRAIQKRKSRSVFPWPLQFAVWFLQAIPNRLYDFLISRRKRKVFG